ncbi:MAG: hypothetical protein CVV49_21840, partial [Spirochaetae bacterium HGW-Spirochaetae-5]
SLFFHNFMVLIVNTIKVAKSRQRLQLPFRFRSTACIRNSGFSAKLKVSAFNKSQSRTKSEVLFNPLLLIHAKRYSSLRQKIKLIL